MIKRVDNNGLVHLVTNIRKPRKWRRFEYLLNDTNSWIDTGVIPTSNTNFDLEMSWNGNTKEDVFFGCSQTSAYASGQNFSMDKLSSHKFLYSFNRDGTTILNSAVNTIYRFLLNGNTLTVNNNVYTVIKGSTFPNWSIYLFARNLNTANPSSDTYTNKEVKKLYYCKLYDNDTLIRDFVPAEYNGLYGLWDLVEDKFYPNKGTGSFTVGPEMKNYDEIYEVRRSNSILPAGVELYDYILSSGTLWIDTKYHSNVFPIRIETEVSYDTTPELDIIGNYPGLVFGSYNNTVFIYAGKSGSWQPSINLSSNTFYKLDVTLIDATTYNLYINGTLYSKTNGNGNSSNILNSDDYTIFTGGKAYHTYNYRGKIKYIRIYSNNQLVRNMLPCTYLGEPGMWDTVENKFYRNQGTGLFTLGNKITLKEYEYLERGLNVQAYINTEIIPTNNTGVYYKWERTTSNNVEDIFFGASKAVTYVSGGNFCLEHNDTNIAIAHGLGYYLIDFAGSPNTIHTYKLNYLNDKKFEADGTTYIDNLSNSAVMPSYSLWIGTRNVTGTIDTLYSFKNNHKIYNIVITNGSSIIRNFVPCSYSGTPGLWDKVEWKFYTNAGSGNFTLGPEKASGIYPVWTPIEYLATGASEQYINTGISVDSSSSVAYDMMFKYEANGVRRLMGPNPNGECYFGANTNNKYDKRYTSVSVGNIDHIYEEFNGITGIITSKINGVTYTGSFYSKSGSLLIFALTSGYNGAGQYFYSGKILKNNLVVRDFIPVRIGNIGYLFDKVTGKMFGNSGTGNFVLGPDINL